MEILKYLGSKIGYSTYCPDIVERTNISTAILFNMLCRHYDQLNKKSNVGIDGFFLCTMLTIANISGLSEYQQREATKNLLKLNLIQLDKRGIPSKNYYKLNFDVIIKFIQSIENDKETDLQTGVYQEAFVHYLNKIESSGKESTKSTTEETKVETTQNKLETTLNNKGTKIETKYSSTNKLRVLYSITNTNKYKQKITKGNKHMKIILTNNFRCVHTLYISNISTSNKYSNSNICYDSIVKTPNNSNIKEQKNSKMAQANRQVVNQDKKVKKPTFEELIKKRTNSEQLLRWLLEFSNSYYNVHNIRLSRASFNLMLDKLYDIDTDDDGRVSIVKTSVERGWKTFFNPDNKPKPSYHNSPSKPLTLEEQKISRKGY